MRVALTRADREVLIEALAHANLPPRVPKAAANAFNALRRHRDPGSVLDRPQYRPAIPLLAAVVSDECLDACIDQLGDHSDDPTMDQLLEAVDAIGKDFPPTVVAVMLASVADGDMNASDLCFELITSDGRFGLADLVEQEGDETESTQSDAADSAVQGDADPEDPAADRAAAERREERRLRRRREAEDRRKRADTARRSAEQMRRARRRRPESPRQPSVSDPADPTRRAAPRLRRRASLTPLQEQEFDRADPLSGAVVFAWIPFDPESPPSEGSGSDLDGKSRPCVVIAGSATHLLVRAGYSQGGMKSRDWKAVELQGWRRSGFDQPTWIDIEMVRVPRDPEQSPMGWLSADDWNALW